MILLPKHASKLNFLNMANVSAHVETKIDSLVRSSRANTVAFKALPVQSSTRGRSIKLWTSRNVKYHWKESSGRCLMRIRG